MCANGGSTDTTAAPEHPGEPDDETRLVEVVRRARNGGASPHDVFETFLRARVYCERPDTPGFLTVTASEVPGEDQHAPRGSRILDLAVVSDATEQPTRLVPVFTSLEQFALFTGGGAWFSTTGADVLGLLPPGSTCAGKWEERYSSVQDSYSSNDSREKGTPSVGGLEITRASLDELEARAAHPDRLSDDWQTWEMIRDFSVGRMRDENPGTETQLRWVRFALAANRRSAATRDAAHRASSPTTFTYVCSPSNTLALHTMTPFWIPSRHVGPCSERRVSA